MAPNRQQRRAMARRITAGAPKTEKRNARKLIERAQKEAPTEPPPARVGGHLEKQTDSGLIVVTHGIQEAG